MNKPTGPEFGERSSSREVLRRELDAHHTTYLGAAAGIYPMGLSEAGGLAREWGRDFLDNEEARKVVDRVGWPSGQEGSMQTIEPIESTIHFPPDERGAKALSREIYLRLSGQSNKDSLNNFYQMFVYSPLEEYVEDTRVPMNRHIYVTKPYLLRFWTAFPELADGLHGRLQELGKAEITQTIFEEYSEGDNSLAVGLLTAHGIMQRLMRPDDLKLQAELLGIDQDKASYITDAGQELRT